MMYLNQLLHDEQVALYRAANPGDHLEVAAVRTLLDELAARIAAYPIAHRPYPSR